MKWIGSLLGLLLVQGFLFRYARNIPGLATLNEFVYIQIVLVFLSSLFYIFSRHILKKVLLPVYISLLLGILTYIYHGAKHGWLNQLQFVLDILFTLVIIYVTAHSSKLTIKYFVVFLKFGVIAAFVLSFSEFIITNYLGFSFLSFEDYWSAKGYYGFHASRIPYAGLGFLIRPWGILAMPQASGSFFAMSYAYFFSRRTTFDMLFVVVSLVAVFISGSRTALFTVIFVTMFISMYSNYSRLIFQYKWLFIFLVPCIIALLLFLTAGQNLDKSAEDFSSDVSNSVVNYYLSFKNIPLILFGAGDSPNVQFTEFGIINNVMRIGLLSSSLIVSSLFMLWAKVRRNRVYKVFNFPILAFLIAALVSDLHYNTFRFPITVLIGIALGILMRDAYQKNKSLEV